MAAEGYTQLNIFDTIEASDATRQQSNDRPPNESRQSRGSTRPEAPGTRDDTHGPGVGNQAGSLLPLQPGDLPASLGPPDPGRDPVGTGLMEAPANKCSFLGILDLLPQAMQAAGVSKVECPVCATTRSLNFRGKTVRFPPHDKRKTRTPHREVRWVKSEAAWELAGP